MTRARYPPGTVPLSRDRAPWDEIGMPDERIEECRCGVLFPTGTAHRCEIVGGWVAWPQHQARQEAAV